MNVKQLDQKYHIELECHDPDAAAIELLVEQNGIKATIRKTSNGQDIPDDEPTVTFRARDRNALPMLHRYMALCVEDGCVNEHIEGVANLIRMFTNFKKEMPHLMKQPGITRGL
jgi:hypothetical protein